VESGRGNVVLTHHYPGETIQSPRLRPYVNALNRMKDDMTDTRAEERVGPCWERLQALLAPGGRLADVRYPEAPLVEILHELLDGRTNAGLLYLERLLERYATRLMPDRWALTARWRDLVFRELQRGGPVEDRRALELAMTFLLLAEGDGRKVSAIAPYVAVLNVQIAALCAAKGPERAG
jgi:hypothetical protein